MDEEERGPRSGVFVKQGGEPGKLRVLHIAGKLSRDKDRSAVPVADPEARMMRAAKDGGDHIFPPVRTPDWAVPGLLPSHSTHQLPVLFHLLRPFSCLLRLEFKGSPICL